MRPFLAMPAMFALSLARMQPAWALTCIDVQQLLDAGVPEPIIVSTIENATPVLTAADAACLAADARASSRVRAAAGVVESAGFKDPKLARWENEVQGAVRRSWHPLVVTCQAHPSMQVGVLITVAGDGTLNSDPEVVEPSGNAPLDQSAVRAVQAASTLPPPPAGVASTFDAKVIFDCATVIVGEALVDGAEPAPRSTLPTSGSGEVGDWSYSLPYLGEMDSSEAKTMSQGKEWMGDLRVACFLGDFDIRVGNLGLTASDPRTDISFDGHNWETLKHERIPLQRLRALMSDDVLYVRWVTRLGTVNDTFSLNGSALAVGAVAAACHVTP